jgi:hypothetical protein
VSEAFGFDSLVVYAPGGKTPMAGAAWPFFFLLRFPSHAVLSSAFT